MYHVPWVHRWRKLINLIMTTIGLVKTFSKQWVLQFTYISRLLVKTNHKLYRCLNWRIHVTHFCKSYFVFFSLLGKFCVYTYKTCMWWVNDMTKLFICYLLSQPHLKIIKEKKTPYLTSSFFSLPEDVKRAYSSSAKKVRNSGILPIKTSVLQMLIIKRK